MRTPAQTIQRNDKIQGVVDLVAEMRTKIDSGYYNFMTWGGRSRLAERLDEYERYAKENTRSRSVALISERKQKLKTMETELHAMLNNTY